MRARTLEYPHGSGERKPAAARTSVDAGPGPMFRGMDRVQRITSTVPPAVNRPSATEPSVSGAVVPGSPAPEADASGRVRRAAPRYGLRVALVIVVAGVLYALMARFALEGYPYSGDEYSSFLQAEGFARGVLKAPAPPFADWVMVDHVIID